MLALSLISLELESCCSDWLALSIDLLSKAQVPVCLTIQKHILIASNNSNNNNNITMK